jgi:hypothetical protein
MTLGLSNNKPTLALSLDTERAFHEVWTTGLISKLIKEGIPAHFIHIINNYLSNAAFRLDADHSPPSSAEVKNE